MSLYSESLKELESINESEDYKCAVEMVGKISNLGVASAVLGGLLRAWCQTHDEDFTSALALMWIADKEAKEVSE